MVAAHQGTRDQGGIDRTKRLSEIRLNDLLEEFILGAGSRRKITANSERHLFGLDVHGPI
jgi:hypothetical protein